jgi:hypothetical protein
MSDETREHFRSRDIASTLEAAMAATRVAGQPNLLRIVCDDGDGPVEYDILFQPRLINETAHGYSRGQSLNPVTFRTEVSSEPDVTVSRMHIGVGSTGDVNKLVTVVMHRSEGREICAHTNLDEDTVITGLRLLFPNGELSGGTEAVAKALVDWWSGFDDDDMADNELVQELEPVVAMAQRALGMT